MVFAHAAFEEYWPCWQSNFIPEARLQLGVVPLSVLYDCTDLQLPDVAKQYLSANELDKWTGFSRKKRRVEWLGGRLAVKFASAGLLNETAVNWQNLVILTEEDGRPYLTAETRGVAPFISISHSGPLAAAMAANFSCGFDIQQPGAKIHTVKECFASLEEEALLNACLPGSFTETERLTMLWAAKEAVRKMVRISPMLGLLEIQLLAGHRGRGAPEEPLLLTCASGRKKDACPPFISVLCFFADNLAWAIGFSPIITR